jgi:hypothetical protein
VKKLAVAALVLFGVARTASAHPLDIGYLRIDSAGRVVSVVLDLEVSVAGELIGEDAVMNIATTKARAAALAEATYRAAPITTEAGACTWTAAPAAILVDRTASLTGVAECPAEARSLRWDLPFLAKMPATFQVLVKARGFAGDRVTIVDHHAPVLELAAAKPEVGLAEMIWSGVAHIGASPAEWRDERGFKLADGIDHILFLLALLLAGGTMLQLAGIATGFTVGHSVTLALAAFGVLRPPAGLIEPVIALTIAVAALEVWSGRFSRHRWKIATAFGLIHGFGFANALTELELSGGRLVTALFGYNLGVELGQLAFVALFSVPIVWLYRRPVVARPVVRAAAAAIFVAGAYWFFERTLSEVGSAEVAAFDDGGAFRRDVRGTRVERVILHQKV